MDITQPALPPTINPVARNQQTDLDERSKNALLRKIDLRLLPSLAIIYFFNYLVRINIRNARRWGLQDHLNLSQSDYSWVVSIFYIAYLLGAIPSILLMRRWSSSKWISCLTLTWGIILMLMTSVYNRAGLLVARFFLGMAEAGFFSGVVFHLSLWYIRKDQSFRIGIFQLGGALACACDGILGYIIEQLSMGGRLAKWQWFFLAEGMATVCIAIVTYKFLYNPATVQWLDQCNKDILTARLLADAKVIDDADSGSLSYQIRSVCLDWKVLLYTLIYTGAATSAYSLNLLLPQIIEDDGYKHPNAELLIVPPYIISCLVTIISSWNTGRLNERSNHLMVLFFIQIIGFLYLILAQKHLYIGTIIIGIGAFSTGALLVSWITNNTGDPTKRAIVIAFAVGFGNIGGLFSGQIYLQLDKASYHQAHYIMIGILGFTIVLVLLFKSLLKYDNKRRRNLTIIEFQGETIAGERPAQSYKHPSFIYVT